MKVITRVVDYGGLFHDDVLPGHPSTPRPSRLPARRLGRGGRERLDQISADADRHGLTPLQLACVWNLAHHAVECVAPTLIQESGPMPSRSSGSGRGAGRRTGGPVLTAEEAVEIRAIGDNRGSMLLKGATPDHEGEERPDRWALNAEQAELASRWGSIPSAT